MGGNLSARRAEMVASADKTDIGKSSLLGLIAGLDWPASGTVTVEGRDPATASNDKLLWRRQRVSTT